jgi:hypothetical protein
LGVRFAVWISPKFGAAVAVCNDRVADQCVINLCAINLLLTRTLPYLLCAHAASIMPLNPLATTPATAELDIYPGLSGSLGMTETEWNSFVLVAPSNAMLQIIYDTGRRDAAAWVKENFNGWADKVSQALTATAVTL